MVDGSGEVHLLLKEHVELGLALGDVFRSCVLALHLLAHVVNLECEDGEAVNSPCRRLCVDGGVREHLDVSVVSAEVCVDVFHHVSAVLVALVDASLEHECFCRVDVRIAYDVLEMPLNCVYPAFVI